MPGAASDDEALDRPYPEAARELAETAQYHNQEGLYRDGVLAARLALIQGEALRRLGGGALDDQRAALRRALAELEGWTGHGTPKGTGGMEA